MRRAFLLLLLLKVVALGFTPTRRRPFAHRGLGVGGGWLGSVPPELVEQAAAADDAGRFMEALPLWEKVCECDPAHAEGHWRLSRLLYLQRLRSPDAQARAEQAMCAALRLSPERWLTDASLHTGETANCVFEAFGPSILAKLVSRGDGVAGTGLEDSTAAAALADVSSVRRLLQRVSFTAPSLRVRFGLPPRNDFGVTSVPVKRLARLGLHDHNRNGNGNLNAASAEDPLDLCIRLFVLGLAVERETTEQGLGSESLQAMERLGMLTVCDWAPHLVVAVVALTPLALPSSSASGASEGMSTPEDSSGMSSAVDLRDLLLVTDVCPPVSVSLRVAQTEEPVMYIGPDSVALLHHLPVAARKARAGCRAYSAEANGAPTCAPPAAAGRDARGEAGDGGARLGAVLDMCCGSGIQGLAAIVAEEAEHVDFVDLNPRALRFTAFNALLNGVDPSCITLHEGDLWEAVGGMNHVEEDEMGIAGLAPQVSGPSCFDLILSNPPYVPVPPKLNDDWRRYDCFADGGPAGDTLLLTILRGLPRYLAPAPALAAIVTEIPNPTTYDGKVWQALEGGQGGQLLARPLEAGRTTGPTEEARSFGVSLVFDAPPPSAEDYAQRRGASPVEVNDWVQHLKAESITTMSNGFVFIQRSPPSQATSWPAKMIAVEKSWSSKNAHSFRTIRRALGSSGTDENM